MNETKKKTLHRNNLKKAAKYVEQQAPGIFFLAFFDAVLEAAYPYVGILLSAEILTELSGKNPDWGHLSGLALVLVGCNFLGRRLLDFLGQLLDVLQYKVYKRIEQSVAVKAWKMDYSLSADPEIGETKLRICRWQYGRGVLALVGQLRELVRALTAIGISLALAVEFFRAKSQAGGRLAEVLNHWGASALFLFLLASSIAYSIYNAAKIQRRELESEERAAKPAHQMESLMGECIGRYQSGKDIRMFHAGEMIFRRMQEMSERLLRETDSSQRYARRMSFLSTSVSRIFHMLVYLFVGLKAVGGAFGAGSILKYTGMVHQLGGGVERLCDDIRDFLQNLECIKIYFEYLDMPNATAEGTLPVTHEIRGNYEFEFRNVTFTYPGASQPSLTKVNCRLRKGEKVAIVGRNGSGKSTFIKLLCRLCDPQEGEILLNGVDIRKYQYEEYLSLFSAVFQDYRLFAFKLGENVAAQSTYSAEKAVKALEDAGFGARLATLEKGLETQLFKYFSEDGVELSGGESQKVAIARCLYKDAPYVVLDEPTAALDPVAEADIYQRMNQFAGGEGTIYISHRLSSCHFCQKILVFEEGRIAEQGSHKELLAAAGLYRRLWDAQAQYYV